MDRRRVSGSVIGHWLLVVGCWLLMATASLVGPAELRFRGNATVADPLTFIVQVALLIEPRGGKCAESLLLFRPLGIASCEGFGLAKKKLGSVGPKRLLNRLNRGPFPYVPWIGLVDHFRRH